MHALLCTCEHVYARVLARPYLRYVFLVWTDTALCLGKHVGDRRHHGVLCRRPFTGNFYGRVCMLCAVVSLST